VKQTVKVVTTAVEVSVKLVAGVWRVHSGSRSGYIHHHDVRVAQHLVGSLAAHQQEVCGLKWSPDGKYLASGGNDNLLNIWPADPGTFSSSATPVYTFNQHQAAVKASSVASLLNHQIRITVAHCTVDVHLSVIHVLIGKSECYSKKFIFVIFLVAHVTVSANLFGIF